MAKVCPRSAVRHDVASWTLSNPIAPESAGSIDRQTGRVCGREPVIAVCLQRAFWLARRGPCAHPWPVDEAERDQFEVEGEESRDLASLRVLVNDGHRFPRGSPEWTDHWDRVEALTRKIRDWAGRPE